MSPSVPASAARTDCRNPRPLLLLLLPLLPHALLPLLLQLLLPHSGMRGGSAGNLGDGKSHAAVTCQHELRKQRPLLHAGACVM
jgi:hypothetical protein